MSRNPHFAALLKKMEETHERKSHDYSKDTNPFSNFEFSELLSNMFTDPSDRVFAVFVGTKLARLAELRSGKNPKNESIEDTMLDLTVYSALWYSKLARDVFEPESIVKEAQKRIIDDLDKI